jgi:thiol-disulfide isomerase/thioredoxin
VALPHVMLTSLDGAPRSLEELLRGRVAVVSLWATWCEACAGEFDALGRLSQRAESRGAQVVAVAVGEPHDAVARFVAWRGLKYPQLVDEDFRFADALGQRRVPATLVIDGAGRITYSGGALDEPALAALRSALDAHVTAAR